MQEVLGHGPSWQFAPQGCPQESLIALHGWVHFLMLGLATFEFWEFIIAFKHCPEWHGPAQECLPHDKGNPHGFPQEKPSRWHTIFLRN